MAIWILEVPGTNLSSGILTGTFYGPSRFAQANTLNITLDYAMTGYLHIFSFHYPLPIYIWLYSP
jgi:hypothetical protein